MNDSQESSIPSAPSVDEIAKKTDPQSDEFDPITALYAKNIPSLDPTTRCFDNLSIFEHKFNKIGSLEIDLSVEQKKNKPPSEASASTSTAADTEKRRFLPEQEMVKGYRRAKHMKNVLNIAENFKGPLSKLYEYMQNKSKVKIYTRHNHGIRGYVTGYIEIFDKHWNMVLRDAEECYRRRKYYFTEQSSGFADTAGEDCSERLKELGIELPEVSVKSLNRKNVECRRKIPQILLRGEQIALVTPH